MGESGFVGCRHVFSIKCSGEVANLLHVAERYGILMEKAAARVETICRQCRAFCRAGGSGSENGRWESGDADMRATA